MTAPDSPPSPAPRSGTPACASQREQRARIDRHFARTIRPADERRLREHLPGCPACKAYYERHLALAQLDPASAPAIDRLRAGLGLTGPPAWLPVRVLGTGAALAAAAALLLLVLPRGERRAHLAQTTPAAQRDGFTARGAAPERDARAALAVFELDAHDQPRSLDAGDTIRAGSELSFAYRNRTENRYLMVFAVDASGAVRWYFPAWTDPADRPRAIAIDVAPGPRRLDEAVRHPLPPGPLELYGLFLPAARDVTDIERRVAAAGGANLDRATLELEPAAILWSRPLTVLP